VPLSSTCYHSRNSQRTVFMIPTATPIYTIEQIKSLESLAHEAGISADILMHRAGQAALQFLLKRWPTATRIAVICGNGNNGGDGYVLAQLAHTHGLFVQVWHLHSLPDLKGYALKAYEACKKAGILVNPLVNKANLLDTDIIVDAILGIGVHGIVKPETKSAIDLINSSQLPILAMDIPSGIDADNGNILGAAIKATATITFLAMKPGLYMAYGVAHCGELVCDDLQLPAELYSKIKSRLHKLVLPEFANYLKPRPKNSHKGDAGHVLVVGSDYGYTGAARMAAEAALRVGAGVVTIATRSKHAATLNIDRPEIMSVGVSTRFSLAALLKKADVVVIGPGLGLSFWAKKLLATVLKTDLPTIMDADALNLLAITPRKREHWILTPHPGEAARLLKTSASEVQANRLASLELLQQTYGGVIVLKGPGSLILGTDGQASICTAGNPGMASAGMGDVLSGVIGGLAAQGIPLSDAAKFGVILHAVAGDLAAKEGERGTLARDLMPHLRRLVNLDIT
jgi:ADP-dependent NAD(P)H-hydrate dehydratase / NAD(P)H-hydrate epimerase